MKLEEIINSCNILQHWCDLSEPRGVEVFPVGAVAQLA